MSKLRLLAMLIAALAATLVLAACGDDDDDGGGGEEDAEISSAIEVSVHTTDPADCTRLQTQSFLEQTNFSTGEEAIQDCEEDVADTANDPDSTDVSEIEVDGTSASANVALEGGSFDGSTLTIDLVKEGDQWKLDRITDIPEFNLEGFRQAFVEQLETEGDVPPEIVQCIGDALQETSSDQVTDAILSGTEADLLVLFGDCIPAS